MISVVLFRGVLQLLNKEREEESKEQMFSFIFQTFKQTWKTEKILTIVWQMTKIKTPTDRHKPTFLSRKNPKLLSPQKKYLNPWSNSDEISS